MRHQRFTHVPLLDSHLPTCSVDFYDSRSPPWSFEPQQHCLVWGRLLHADPEGPTLISYYSTESPILVASIHVTPPIATGWSERCRVGFATMVKTVPLHGALTY
jgi:hypothetical protein